MTESDLDQVLAKAARRLRVERAFRAGLSALGIGLVLAAAVVLWARLTARDVAPIAVALSIPPALTMLALVAIYLRNRPDIAWVALLLDRRAGSDEHLVTWHDLRGRPAAAETQLQKEFIAAQRAATLEKARSIDPRKLIPIHFPDWSRMLLLAFLLLCCAWLAPALDKPRDVSGENNRPRRVASAQRSSGGESAANVADESPSVEVLSQTDLQRFQLVASDPMLNDSRKSEEFQKLMAKLGGIPENQLTPLDRQLLNQLRTDGAKTARAEEKRGGDDGTVQNTGGNDPGKGDSSGKVGAPATIPEMNARALSAMHEQFPANEQQRLEKYYGKK
jgi:hypothetical protein